MNLQELEKLNKLAAEIKVAEGELEISKNYRGDTLLVSHPTVSTRQELVTNIEDMREVITLIVSLNEKRLAGLKEAFANITITINNEEKTRATKITEFGYGDPQTREVESLIQKKK